MAEIRAWVVDEDIEVTASEDAKNDQASRLLFFNETAPARLFDRFTCAKPNVQFGESDSDQRATIAQLRSTLDTDCGNIKQDQLVTFLVTA
jgi:hypothetical protein